MGAQVHHIGAIPIGFSRQTADHSHRRSAHQQAIFCSVPIPHHAGIDYLGDARDIEQRIKSVRSRKQLGRPGDGQGTQNRIEVIAGPEEIFAAPTQQLIAQGLRSTTK